MTLQEYLYNLHNERMTIENTHKSRIKVYPHKGEGKVIYSPAVKDVCDPTWVILECDIAIVNYYKWFLAKRGIKVDSLLWGSHISVVRGGKYDTINPQYSDRWGYNDGQLIQFSYGDLVTNGTHWWLEVESKELEVMRKHLGLKPHPDFGFHVTIGKISEFRRK